MLFCNQMGSVKRSVTPPIAAKAHAIIEAARANFAEFREPLARVEARLADAARRVYGSVAIASAFMATAALAPSDMLSPARGMRAAAMAVPGAAVLRADVGG